MQWLLDLFGSLGSSRPTAQTARPGVPEHGPATVPQSPSSAGDGERSSGGDPAARKAAMSEGMARILAATLLSNPTGQTFPGAVAPARPVPFQYTPTKAIPVDPRQGLRRV